MAETLLGIGTRSFRLPFPVHLLGHKRRSGQSSGNSGRTGIDHPALKLCEKKEKSKEPQSVK